MLSPSAIADWVRFGTPSMSLRIRNPCQCTVVGSGNRLTTSTSS